MHEPRELTRADYAALVPRPAADTHKYARGSVLVVGGSSHYPGAPVLAALAAQRAGAGYVRLAMPQAAAAIAQTHVLSIPVSSCSQEEGAFAPGAAEDVLRAGAKSTVFVVGPGLTTSPHAVGFVERLFSQLDALLVADADVLNIVAERPWLWERLAGRVNILTPHEGEAARLLGHAVDDRLAAAHELAQRFGAVAVLKGPRTLVASPDGQCSVCVEGGPELAKAGTGDVLAGMVGALAAQGLPASNAAALAVYLHARAGALAARQHSVLGVTPEDVIAHIGPAVRELQ